MRRRVERKRTIRKMTKRPRYVGTTNKARNIEEVDTEARAAAVCSAISKKHLHNEQFEER